MNSHHTAVRRYQFCSGHRVHLHESKCRNMHGHNYVVFIHARGLVTELDQIGRVIDFGDLKFHVGGWIDQNWDHGFIYFKDDPEMASMFNKGVLNMLEGKKTPGLLEGHKSYALPNNPTAENMAEYLCETICPRVLDGTGIEVYKIVLWETENCNVEYVKS